MKKLKLILMFICLSSFLVAEEGYIYFVVDGSGSMKGTPLLEAKNSMQKMATIFFSKGQKIALVVGKDSCGGGTHIATKFFTSLAQLTKAMNRIQLQGTHNITLGFEYAQEEMKKRGYRGHIYMFGDCDGLEHCRSIKQIAKKYKDENYLTPFTYLQVDGCTKAEKRSWNKTFKDIGAKTGMAATFDYKTIISKKIDIYKKYFTKLKFINIDSSENSANNFRTNPWRCIKADGLHWLVLTSKEKEFNFYVKPQHTLTQKEIKIEDFIKLLDNQITCGKNKWRLPSHFELSRLTQIGIDFRARMFPNIILWPHISSTGGDYNGFKKGVNLEDGSSSDYREDRPYSAIFVSGDIDKDLFEVPLSLMERYNLIYKIKSTPVKKIKKCTELMFSFSECSKEECIIYGDCKNE